MKSYIQTYLDEVEGFINSDMATASREKKEEMLAEFEKKIVFFSHERLVHLIVTVLFAVLEIITLLAFLHDYMLDEVILAVMFLVLLVPYVFHYYFLENSVQRMYKMRDAIIKAIK